MYIKEFQLDGYMGEKMLTFWYIHSSYKTLVRGGGGTSAPCIYEYMPLEMAHLFRLISKQNQPHFVSLASIYRSPYPHPQN